MKNRSPCPNSHRGDLMHADLARAVLALEDGLISSDQFVTACSALAFEPAESFSTYLRSKGWVAAERISALEDRLKNDRRLSGERAIATGAYVSVTDGAGSTVADQAGTPIPAERSLDRERFELKFASSPERYQIAGLHARGGMGQVWLARDRLMQRE